MYTPRLGILRSLHEEHVTALARLDRLAAVLAANGPGSPPDAGDAGIAKTLDDVAATLGDDITHHFAFEEAHLFPLFAERADPGIAEMLRQEHEIIRPLAERLVAIIAAAKPAGFTAESWAELHDVGGEVAEREVFHIQKEEMGFLPALDQMLDDAEDGPLQMAFVEMKGG
jgi:hemerythrin-like domain-containing protein